MSDNDNDGDLHSDGDEPAAETVADLDISNDDLVGTARRKYGRGGGILAAGMLGLDKVLHDKKKTESVQVQEAASEPVDVDADGIEVVIDDDLTVHAPALERKEPIAPAKKKRPRSGRTTQS